MWTWLATLRQRAGTSLGLPSRCGIMTFLSWMIQLLADQTETSSWYGVAE